VAKLAHNKGFYPRREVLGFPQRELQTFKEGGEPFKEGGELDALAEVVASHGFFIIET
jgi:hypothetical protein